MIIIYGDVELHYETARTCEYRAVYSPDGADFSYYHFRLGAVCEVARYATGGIDGQGIAIEALSRIMMEPGQRLTVADDVGNVFVDSPEGLGVTAVSVTTGQRGGYYDCNQGPKPVAFEILEMRPSETTQVYFEVETWIKRCPGLIGGNAGQVPVLYHRWEERHSIDELLYTTRTITGEVRFRSDVLRRIDLAPDDYRSLLFPYIPKNFRREGIEVYTSKDGLNCYYTTRDVEQSRLIAQQLSALHVQKVEAKFFSGLDMISNVFPVRTKNLVIEAWGDRRCQPDLVAERLAVFFATAGFGVTPILGGVGGAGFVGDVGPILVAGGFAVPEHRNGFEVDLKRRYVRAEIHYHSALTNPTVSALDDIRRVLAASQGNLFVDTLPGQGNRVEGTYLGRIVHQVLKSPSNAPKLPPLFPDTLPRRNLGNVDQAHRIIEERLA